MKLTGKCKKAFDKWRLNIHQKEWVEKPDSKGGYEYYGYSIFKELPFSMQYGVYVDFFDSVTMQIYVKPTSSIDGNWSVYIDDFGHHILTEYIYRDTRHEARTEAIKKANEIYNEKHSD